MAFNIIFGNELWIAILSIAESTATQINSLIQFSFEFKN